jgi:fucose permease
MRKNMTAVIALMAVFTVAICFIILGSISSELMKALGINEGQFGSLIMGLYLTSCIVQLFIGPFVDKAGYKPIAVTGFIVVSLSMFLLAFASGFTAALIACILLGIGAISLNTVGNTLIPVVLFKGADPARASNFGNGFFGLGYTLTPLLIIFILKVLNLNYTVALIILAVLSLVLLTLVFITDFPKVSTGYKFSMAVKLIPKPAVLIAAFALFCYSSLEASLGSWIKKLMEGLYGGTSGIDTAVKAGLVLSIFGVAMMVSRFLFSTIKNLTSIGSRLLAVTSVIAAGAIILLVVAGNPGVAIVGVILAGMALAPIFPTIVGITFAKFDMSLYGSIFGIIFAAGMLGGTFVPKIIGNLSTGSSVQQGLTIAAVIAVILFVISLFIGRVGVKKTE